MTVCLQLGLGGLFAYNPYSSLVSFQTVFSLFFRHLLNGPRLILNHPPSFRQGLQHPDKFFLDLPFVPELEPRRLGLGRKTTFF